LHLAVPFARQHQQFNTTTSMGRVTLKVLLSFAQFEREVTSEWIRDRRLQTQGSLGRRHGAARLRLEGTNLGHDALLTQIGHEREQPSGVFHSRAVRLPTCSATGSTSGR